MLTYAEWEQADERCMHRLEHAKTYPDSQFTCFTGTKTNTDAARAKSFGLLLWYPLKAARRSGDFTSTKLQMLTHLLVQKYKC